eukprot:TRINITY_DN119_c1_g4_i1.p1 TRINITY_DN119_c1_g4~~TRINITY_DN119_c1_g4_i1.p1  ORF type:complete len:1171 (-),score=592.90 TRINITY_DN119_c1_g4_i1:114-3626(-)
MKNIIILLIVLISIVNAIDNNNNKRFIPRAVSASNCPKTTNPTSPTITTNWTIPSATFGPWAGSNWKARVSWGDADYTNTYVRAETVSGAVNLVIDRPWSKEFNLILNSGAFVGTLYQGHSYTLSFVLEQSAANVYEGGKTPTNQPLNMTVVVGYGYDIGEYEFYYTASCPWSKSCTDVYSKHFLNGILGTSKTYNLNFVAPAYYYGPIQVGFKINTVGALLQTNNNRLDFFFRNLRIVKAARNRQLGPALTKFSERVVINKQIPLSQVTFSTTNCPQNLANLKLWHTPSTWPNNQVPIANGATITLPAGQILLDACRMPTGWNSGVFGNIIIPAGSELIFADRPVNIRIRNIFVAGRLRIGSETCRIQNQITITIDESAQNHASYGACGRKTICVLSSGQLDIHARRYHPTWTSLAATAQAGDDRILLQDNVNWQVGQQIMITTTAWNNDGTKNEFEVRTISAVVGNKIQFPAPLKFVHYAGIEYQAEVALLSRRILIQGDLASETNQFGGHIMSMGQMRVSGVQLIRMGQRNVLARYPLHFHRMGSSPSSFMQENTVQNSYFRCYTVHGTNSTRLSRNVAFNVTGHCYYIEDGVEENNLFEHNLAANVNPITETPGVATNWYANGYGQDGITVNQNSNLQVPADIAAGGFYITNANNRFIGNVAVGGFAGYSFVTLPLPIGAYASWTYFNPSSRPLLQFSSNSARAAAWQWHHAGCIYFGAKLWSTDGSGNNLRYTVGRFSRDPRNNTGGEVYLRLQDTRVSLCNFGTNFWGSRIEIVNYESHDCKRTGQLFGPAWLSNALINARSNNPTINRPITPINGWEYYDTWSQAILTRITFRNFNNPLDEIIISLIHSDYFKPQGISAIRNVTFQNCVNNVVEIGHNPSGTGASRYYNVIDFDGTLSKNAFGSNVPALIGAADSELYPSTSTQIKEWWKITPSCILRSAWNTWLCQKTAGLEVGYIDFLVNGLVGWLDESYWTEKKPSTILGRVAHFDGGLSTVRSTLITNNPGVAGPTGNSGWYLWLDQGSPARLKLAIKQIPTVPGFGRTHIMFSISYPSSTTFTITTTHRWDTNLNANVVSGNSVSAVLNDPNGRTYYWDSANGRLFLKLISILPNGRTGLYFERDGARLYDQQYYYYNIVASCSSNCNTQSTSYETFYRVNFNPPPPI